jgi:hypothetical protein
MTPSSAGRLNRVLNIAAIADPSFCVADRGEDLGIIDLQFAAGEAEEVRGGAARRCAILRAISKGDADAAAEASLGLNRRRIERRHDDSSANRWKAALNAFDITFDGRLSAGPK